MNAILGIDTSGRIGAAALLALRDDGPALEEELPFKEGLIHGVALAPAVHDLLGAGGLGAGDLSLIAVGLGPGSYTGVRVGVAFAKTLSFAAGVPVVGVPSFDAIARNAPADRVVAVVRNARRDALYVGLYDPPGRRRGLLRLVPLAEVGKALPPNALVLGDGTESHAGFLSGDGREFGDRAAGEARAVEIARLGLARFEAEGADSAHDLAPIYLRQSEAEERAKRRDGNAG